MAEFKLRDEIALNTTAAGDAASVAAAAATAAADALTAANAAAAAVANASQISVAVAHFDGHDVNSTTNPVPLTSVDAQTGLSIVAIGAFDDTVQLDEGWDSLTVYVQAFFDSTGSRVSPELEIRKNGVIQTVAGGAYIRQTTNDNQASLFGAWPDHAPLLGDQWTLGSRPDAATTLASAQMSRFWIEARRSV